MKWTVYITNKFKKKLIFYEFIYKLIQSIPNLYRYILREMLRLQYFYNKLQVVSCYWFKFQTNAKITITTSNNLPLRILCKNVVDISFI